MTTDPIVISLVVGFFVIRFAVSILNLISNPRLKTGSLSRFPKVSILVPARNEAQNIPGLVSQVKKLNYQNLEFIFLDDNSEDQTLPILQKELKSVRHAKILNGAPLPEGWLGKNWACHQLGEAATGEYLLFVDADVSFLHPKLVTYSLAQMETLKVSLLSLFPDQIMKSPGEKMVVPLMNYLLLSLLPLWWIYRLRFPSMAAANGQFMLFEGKSYRKHWWHKRVKDVIVEDIEIMREVKRMKEKGMTFLGNGFIATRMYQNWWEGVLGFGKNILAGFNNSVGKLFFFLGLTVTIWVNIFYDAWIGGYFLELGLIWVLIGGMRAAISFLSGQSILQNLLYHPLQMGSLFVIGMYSIYNRITGKIIWKGRNVSSR